MVKRRSLDDALTPEEEEFVRQSAPKASKPKTKKPKPKKETPPMSKPAFKQEIPPSFSQPANEPGEQRAARTSSVNARIDPLITTALLRASFERRLQRQTPTTQQDIIAEALTQWLKKHGYLK